MTAEHLLRAMGLLDDDLIQEAEILPPRKARPNYRQWLTWAASFAVVIALGYGVTHLWTTGGGSANNTASGNSMANGSQANTMEPAPDANESDWNLGTSPSPGSAGGNQLPGDQDETFPAIMVDGVLYWSTGRPVPVEPAPEVIQTVTSYTNGTPESDGQTNFSQDLTAQYARIKIGSEWKLVVLMELEWILFEPAA